MENKTPWLSKLSFKSLKTISKMNKPPRISSTRYGALKTLQLPAETSFKQTNLFDFVKQKSVKPSKNVKAPISVIKKFEKVNSPPKYKNIDANLKQAKLLHQDTDCISSRCKFKEQQSKKQTVSSHMISNKIQAAHTTHCLDSQKNAEIKHLTEPIEEIQTLANKNETQWLNNDAKSSDKVNSKTGASKTLLMNESLSTSSNHYDMTMRFVTDSQGLMQFDHFSQKHTLYDNKNGMSLDSQLYLEFAKGIASDHQSTQIM